VLARFAEPQQLKAIKDGLTLGLLDCDGLYLPYCLLLTKALVAENIIKSIFPKIAF